MASKIVVPDLGESITEATVLRWLKKEGDPVALGDVLLELETDKVNVEVGSEHTGVLTRIIHREGEDVKIGDELGTIDEAAAAGDKPSEAPAKPQAAEPKSSEKAAPEAKATEKKNGQAMRVSEPETKPAAPEPEKKAPKAPPAEPERKPAPAASSAPPEHDPAIFPPPAPETEEEPPRPPASQGAPPAARPAPRTEPLQTGRITGTVEKGKGQGREEHLPMSRRRRTIAERLVEAKLATAMLTTFNEIDMSKVMDLRQRFKESFSNRHRVSLGIMPFFVKAVTSSLKAHPMLNAEIRGNEIILKHFHDIGIAIDVGDGLVVPTLRNADTMTFAEIEESIREYARKAREGELEISDLRGGSFTITNGGVFGSLLSTPILNPPQVGILGLHKIQDRAVVIDGQIVIRPMMYTALSYDHRLIDGRDAVGFLITLKEFVENPEELLLEG